MNIFSMMKRARLMKPEGDDSGAGAVDRGDDFQPTAEDINKAEKAGVATAEELEAERAKLGLKSPAAAAAPAKTDAPAAELTEEEKAAAAAEERRKDTRVPLARHESILAKERAAREALEVELRTLKQGQTAIKTSEQLTALEDKIVGLEVQYTELLADGKVKEAQAIMTQIRQSERQVIQQRATFETQAATAQAIEQVRYDATVERLEAAYPQIVPGHADFDADAVTEVLELASAYELKNFTPSAALQKAVGYVLKPASVKQADAVTVTPRVTEDAAAAAAERTTAARKAAAAVVNAQPPNAAKVGAPSDAAGGVLDAKSAIKMSPEKFAALSEEDLARMRGDTL